MRSPQTRAPQRERRNHLSAARPRPTDVAAGAHAAVQCINPTLQPIPLPNERMTPAKKNLTFNDLEHWLNARRVTEVECLVPDLTGVARGKILPREKFT